MTDPITNAIAAAPFGITHDDSWVERQFPELPGEKTSNGSRDISHPFGQVRRRRFEIIHDRGSGYRDFIAMSDDLHAVSTDVSFTKSSGGYIDGLDLLKFHFKLSGNNVIRFDGQRELQLRGGAAAIATHPRGLKKHDWYGHEVPERSLTLCCKPELVTRTLQLDPDCLPQELRGFLTGGAIDFFCQDVPLTARMTQTINELLNPPYSPAIRHIHAQARMLDLICMLVDRLTNDSPTTPLLVLRPREVEALHEAKAILESSLEGIPTIPELARRVGVNRTKLMQGFKHLFAETVFDFSQRVRLNHARRLLLDTDQPISAIAADVGYEHHSSFSVAFRAFFGISPRELRQQ